MNICGHKVPPPRTGLTRPLCCKVYNYAAFNVSLEQTTRRRAPTSRLHWRNRRRVHNTSNGRFCSSLVSCLCLYVLNIRQVTRCERKQTEYSVRCLEIASGVKRM
ncbi:hypothetical protein DPMN_087952 [Dreissena polymorpha]|uniref:Uncharacterized protein n=1 Tax=Dreissena polymorpha TaxID=45954 RepID=A0A9D4QVZ7_DREPO|nr:hypothetical protein DPMN_087952 [Dreissena polymorpha]